MTARSKRLLIAFLALAVTLILKTLDFQQTWLGVFVLEALRWVVGAE